MIDYSKVYSISRVHIDPIDGPIRYVTTKMVADLMKVPHTAVSAGRIAAALRHLGLRSGVQRRISLSPTDRAIRQRPWLFPETVDPLCQ